MANITYEGEDLGEVQSIREVRQAGLTTFPIPGQTKALIYDLGGLTKRMNVTTHFRGTTNEITTFLAQLDTWCNARQGAGKQLALPFGRGTAFGDSVIENWEWDTDSTLGGQTDAAENLIIKVNISFIAGEIINVF